MLAVTDAATPSARVARTAQRTRRSWGRDTKTPTDRYLVIGGRRPTPAGPRPSRTILAVPAHPRRQVSLPACRVHRVALGHRPGGVARRLRRRAATAAGQAW